MNRKEVRRNWRRGQMMTEHRRRRIPHRRNSRMEKMPRRMNNRRARVPKGRHLILGQGLLY